MDKMWTQSWSLGIIKQIIIEAVNCYDVYGMRRFVHRICNILKIVSFWGTISLLILTFGYKIDINVIWIEAFTGTQYVQTACVYLMGSSVVFAISIIFSFLGLVWLFREEVRFKDVVLDFFPHSFKQILSASFKGSRYVTANMLKR